MNAKINEQLRPLVVPLDSLHLDEFNAMDHPDENLAAIMKSLQTFGQQKPIVALKNGTIIAGNGTWDSARRLGWSEIAVVQFDDDKEVYAKAYAIADNRTAQLSTWNEANLQRAITEIKAEIVDATITGFDEKRIEKIIAEVATEARETSAREINTDEYTLAHRCPKCGFQFND
jgi:ParB-like chromosome segregation protein Spo0J